MRMNKLNNKRFSNYFNSRTGNRKYHLIQVNWFEFHSIIVNANLTNFSCVDSMNTANEILLKISNIDRDFILF